LRGIHRLDETGALPLASCKKNGSSTLAPEVERAYYKCYLDLEKSEAKLVLPILKQYLDEDSMKILTMLTRNNTLELIANF
jgi:hypothetical protein